MVDAGIVGSVVVREQTQAAMRGKWFEKCAARNEECPATATSHRSALRERSNGLCSKECRSPCETDSCLFAARCLPFWPVRNPQGRCHRGCPRDRGHTAGLECSLVCHRQARAAGSLGLGLECERPALSIYVRIHQEGPASGSAEGRAVAGSRPARILRRWVYARNVNRSDKLQPPFSPMEMSCSGAQASQPPIASPRPL
jgi:hypothetical protein